MDLGYINKRFGWEFALMIENALNNNVSKDLLIGVIGSFTMDIIALQEQIKIINDVMMVMKNET